MAAAMRYDWEAIRAAYEAGATMGELSRQYGVDKAAVSRRAKKEGWTADLRGAVNRLAEAKVNGIVNTVDPKKRAEAVDNAAEQTAAIIRRWRVTLEQLRAMGEEARREKDFELAKLVKISTETEKIQEDCERKAYNIPDVAETKTTIDMAKPVTINLASLDPAVVDRFVDATFGIEGDE